MVKRLFISCSSSYYVLDFVNKCIQIEVYFLCETLNRLWRKLTLMSGWSDSQGIRDHSPVKIEIRHCHVFGTKDQNFCQKNGISDENIPRYNTVMLSTVLGSVPCTFSFTRDQMARRDSASLVDVLLRTLIKYRICMFRLFTMFITALPSSFGSNHIIFLSFPSPSTKRSTLTDDETALQEANITIINYRPINFSFNNNIYLIRHDSEANYFLRSLIEHKMELMTFYKILTP